jgi:hypothetical protein
LDAGLKKLCGDQAAAIHEYFRSTHRHRELPRVGIHGVTDEEEVVDIVIAPSAQKRNVVVTGKCAGSYSSLGSVFASGFPYLCNSVPAACIKDVGYKNGDFDLERVREQYRKKVGDSKLLARWQNNFLRKTQTDTAWTSLATGASERPQVYKSQLMIPITYRTHADFGRLDANLIDILGLLDDGRSILGLVTVDHPAAYYFDDGPPQSFENIDINILYLFADMLSLIFVTQFMYTIGSESVNQYRERYSEHVLS